MSKAPPSKPFAIEIRSRSSFEPNLVPARGVPTSSPFSGGLSVGRAESTAPAASSTMRSRVSHEALEELLQNWARWCLGRVIVSGSVVLELEYRAAGDEALQARRTPNPGPPKDHDGLLIERLVNILPELQRRVIRVEYVHARRRQGETGEAWLERKRRRVRIPRWHYEETLRLARNHLAALLARPHT